jgi:tetratricopeptide (TPR) repeat protein
VTGLVADAIYLLDEAAKYPELASEAEVRKAVVLLRLSRPREALPLVQKVYGHAAEPAVNYLAALVEGRVLEALDRPDDAAEAYKRAVLLFPRAQSPFVAMAALRFKQDLRADALEWASRARTTSAGSADPWWEYWMGDFRFVPTWLGAVRKAALVTAR